MYINIYIHIVISSGLMPVGVGSDAKRPGFYPKNGYTRPTDTSSSSDTLRKRRQAMLQYAPTTVASK